MQVGLVELVEVVVVQEGVVEGGVQSGGSWVVGVEEEPPHQDTDLLLFGCNGQGCSHASYPCNAVWGHAL